VAAMATAEDLAVAMAVVMAAALEAARNIR